MAEAGVDAFLVPRADAHQGENVAPRDERLAWLTGFTGSAGIAARHRRPRRRSSSTAATACRSATRSTPRSSPSCVSPRTSPPTGCSRCCPAAAASASTRGSTPPRRSRRSRPRSGPRQIGLVRVANLVDAAWPDQPPAPAAADRAATRTNTPGAPPPRSGRRSPRGLVARDLAAAVLTLPDSIAWLLNIRGADIARTPVPLAFAILHADGRVALFTDPAKADDALRAHLGPEVAIRPEADFGPALDALRGRVAVDEASAPVWVADRLAAAERPLVRERDPCILPKATQDRGRDRRHPRRPPPRRARRWPSSSPGSTSPPPRAG